MEPQIISSRFGGITLLVEGKPVEYSHDILIRLGGAVEKRKKKLSRQVYGTSHTISLAEAQHIYQEGAELLLIGAGKFKRVALSPEAAAFFQERGLAVRLERSARAVKSWNALTGPVLGLFHITC